MDRVAARRGVVRAVLLLLPLLALLLLCAAPGAAAAGAPFRVFEPCSKAAGDGVNSGMCRRQPRATRAKVALAPKPMPIDMRLPCDDPAIPCYESVDVAAPPRRPHGAGLDACNVTLVPWSPFPCRFDAARAEGVPSQPSDLCYSGAAANLTTDGYYNYYTARLPAGAYTAAALCPRGWAGGAAGGGKGGGGGGARVRRLMLTVEFRLAAGRQFDRMYSLQIGAAVAALGTCGEPVPARVGTADKTWSVTADVTHLQPYLEKSASDLPVRLRLDNVLSNVYNVPIWAAATLQVIYHRRGPPSAASRGPAAGGGGAARALLGGAVGAAGAPGSESAAAAPRRRDREGAGGSGVVNRGFAPAAADVPDDLLPLVVEAAPGVLPAESLATLSGTGDSPASWPNVTFELPASLSEPGDIYRAQVVVTPKANGCEEFWAMNPSGRLTASMCGGVSVGEPYREVRVYVNGQLAGFSPIWYTFYTGGVDPRLWMAIAAHPTYQLPAYTFDLSPWLGLLNDAAVRRSITIELHGATGSDWQVASQLRVWRAPGAGCITALRPPAAAASPGLLAPAESACVGEALDTAAATGRCLLELEERSLRADAAISVGGTVFLAAVEYRVPSYRNYIEFNGTSGFASWRQATLGFKTAWSLVEAPPLAAAAAAAAAGAGGGGCLAAAGAVAAVAAAAAARAPLVVTRDRRRYDWLNAGGVAERMPYEISYNMTLLAPTVYMPLRFPAAPPAPGGAGAPAAAVAAAAGAVVLRGEQRHYQRAVMWDVYGAPGSAAPPPANATLHTAALSDTVAAAGGGRGGGGRVCVAWEASAGFGSAKLITNDFESGLAESECAPKPQPS
ncbi:MAG: hypothetical protein J3K34DRAFT_456983 [Monoraphidium minutum]|nr:MAG: hypothetical protein J3K34DRAFT_456983 [Monoraphidium minutum]